LIGGKLAAQLLQLSRRACARLTRASPATSKYFDHSGVSFNGSGGCGSSARAAADSARQIMSRNEATVRLGLRMFII
jgi:hypothetical protein